MLKEISENVSCETISLPKINLYLDISSSNTGVIIDEIESGRLIMDNIDLTYLKKPAIMNQVDYEKIKIALMKEYFDTLKISYKIQKVWCEGIFIQPKFLKSSQMLIKIHGFIMSYFLDTETMFIPPKVIKKDISGNGNANKETIKSILEQKYQITIPNNDISDALALYTCVNGYQNKSFLNNLEKEG